MKTRLILFTFCAITLQLYAQKQIRPDWLMEKPEASNSTFRYAVITGMGDTQEEALQDAQERIYDNIIGYLGEGFNVTNKGITKKERGYNIPHHTVCTYYEQKDDVWYAYLLCQIAINGRTTPHFDDFRSCNSHKKYRDFIKKKNAGALAASVFVPGLGQMTKRHFGEGLGTLFGEAALIGGGVTMLQLAKPYKTVMDDISGNVDYDTYMNAKNKYNTFHYVSYGFFGAAAIFYGINLWRAWACDYKFKEVALYPTVIPDASSLGYAMGVGVNINF